MLFWSRIILLIVAFTAAVAAQEPVDEPYVAEHPLDALTAEEVSAAAGLVRAAGVAGNDALFAAVTLAEPDKAFVRNWVVGQTFQRAAFVVVRDRGKTFEVDVDLTASRVLAIREKAGAQPMIMDREWTRARDSFEKDSRFLAALARRGLVADDSVFCTPNSAGNFPGEAFSGRRIVKVPCFTSRDELHPTLARPIEGIMGVVDSETGEVLDVLDRQIVALPPAPQGYGETLPPTEPPIRVQDLASPQGSNIEVSGNLFVEWLKWSFHVRSDKRAGLIVSLVRFQDGLRLRDYAYQMNVSEMFVPYMDPDPTWSYRTFMDVGEFGLGYLISSLEPGVDCPRNALYADVTIPNDTGGTFVRERGLCIFERNTGDPGWRHYRSGSESTSGVPQVELVVRHIPTLGNYDYVIDYVFTPQGNVRLRVGATGFDAIKSVSSRDMDSNEAAVDTQYGSLIAPYTVAPFHDHYINFRLDLDADGPLNVFVRDTFTPSKADGVRKSLWTLQSDSISSEGAVPRDHGAGVVWRMANLGTKNSLKQNPSLWLNTHHDASSVLDPADPPQMRAQFSSNALWLTRYKKDELWAAGPYPNLSQSDEGLPGYTADRESLENADIVAWYTMGFRHLTRPEDFPILPTFWHEFTIRPAFFFDKDPSMTFNSGIPPFEESAQ